MSTTYIFQSAAFKKHAARAGSLGGKAATPAQQEARAKNAAAATLKRWPKKNGKPGRAQRMRNGQ